jgi:hypothetical protein
MPEHFEQAYASEQNGRETAGPDLEIALDPLKIAFGGDFLTQCLVEPIRMRASLRLIDPGGLELIDVSKPVEHQLGHFESPIQFQNHITGNSVKTR